MLNREPQALPLDRASRAHGACQSLASPAYRRRLVRDTEEHRDVHAAARGRLLPRPFARRSGEDGGLNAHNRSTRFARDPITVQGLRRRDVAAGDGQAQRSGAVRTVVVSEVLRAGDGSRCWVAVPLSPGFASDRRGDGSLTPAVGSPVAIGGAGRGAGLGSQGAIEASPDGRYLLAVDAGSNEISVLRVGADGTPRLVGSPVPSGGVEPVSITISP